MSPNCRILLNIVATYGRSLYALVIGLFSARWAFQALGQVDYGLMGVVGGLTGFIAFFNGLISMAVSRFYAISIGKESIATTREEGLIECQKWFSTAVFLHTTIPIMLMAIGYPIGIWCVRNFLTIPVDRVGDCVWVFRFVCMTCFLGMVSVPVNAMYQAKQYIAELTIYSFMTVTLNAGFLYYMVNNPGIWLAKYAFWMCILGVTPQLVIFMRGLSLFPECKLIPSECVSMSRFREMLYFVGFWAIGCSGGLLRSQGMQILVNKYFGPQFNASMSVATSVNGNTMMLSSSMIGAFQPAIVSAYGAGDVERMRTLSYFACKFAMLLTLIFSIPLGLELGAILKLWLIDPPQAVHGLCLTMLVMTVIDQSTVGHMLAVNAKGKIAKYQIFLGGSLVMTLPLAWLFCALGGNVYCVGFSMILTMAFCAWGRVWFARDLAGMSARYWIWNILLPVVLLATLSILVGFLPIWFLQSGVLRIISTTVTCEFVLLSGAWLLVLNTNEREYVKQWSSRVSERLRCAKS